jgi:hypothetical protein
MTYEIEIIEPRAQKLLEELVNLNLIKFIRTKPTIEDNSEELPPTREEIKEGWAENTRQVAAAIRGDIKLPSIYDVLEEMENEQKLEKKLL